MDVSVRRRGEHTGEMFRDVRRRGTQSLPPLALAAAEVRKGPNDDLLRLDFGVLPDALDVLDHLVERHDALVWGQVSPNRRGGSI